MHTFHRRFSASALAWACFVFAVGTNLSAVEPPGGATTGRVLHVSPEGSDKGDGSPGRPFKSIKMALRSAASGDEVRLTKGDHEGGFRTQTAGVTISGRPDAVVRCSPNHRGIEVLHDDTHLRGFTLERADIGIWLSGVSKCVVEDLTLREMAGEGIRLKNQSCNNVIRRCVFERMGRTGFDVAKGKKNGEGVYIGTAPEQREKNDPPDVPDRCLRNVVEDCTFQTEAAEAVDIKEDSEQNIVRRCSGRDSRDPEGAIFGSRGDSNRFEACVARDGRGHGFRFGGDTVPAGKFGQTEHRVYGMNNVMRDCVAENNARYGVAEMVRPQDIDASNRFKDNSQGDRKR